MLNKYYVTFGQAHVHYFGGKTLDRNCVAVIYSVNKEEAQEKAMDFFHRKFCNVYDELPDMSFYPRGIIYVE